MKFSLSDRQKGMLAGCFRCCHIADTWGAPCVFPRGSGQHRTVDSLVARGLLQFRCMGYDIDGEVEGDVALFEPTDAGVALALELGLVEPGYCMKGVGWGLRAACTGFDPFGNKRDDDGNIVRQTGT